MNMKLNMNGSPTDIAFRYFGIVGLVVLVVLVVVTR